MEGDEQRAAVEDRRDPVTDELDDRAELELFGEGLADLVDERQLRVALAGLLDGPDAGQRRADVLADEGEQVSVCIGVCLAGSVGLAHDDADRSTVGDQRRPDPFPISDNADLFELAGGDQLPVRLAVEDQGPSGPEHVRRHAAAESDPDGIPGVRIRHERVDRVHVVGEVDRLAIVVVERDVEVLGVHEPRDRLVDDAIELRQILGGARRLRDAVQGGLDPLRTVVLGLARLERRDRRPEGGGVSVGSGWNVDWLSSLRRHAAPIRCAATGPGARWSRG